MQPPTRGIHVLRLSRIVQSEELFAQSLGMSRLNSGSRSRLKELLDTLMPEALNHITERIVSLYSVSIEIDRKPKTSGANHNQETLSAGLINLLTSTASS